MEQAGLRWISHILTTAYTGIIVKYGIIQQISVCPCSGIYLLRLNTLSGNIHILHCHPVLGQGSCLIRADNGHAAKTFHSLKFLDYGIVLSHLPCAHSLNNGHYGTQCLRDCRHSQCYSKHKGRKNGLSLPYPQCKYYSTDHHYKYGKLLAEIIKAHLKGSLSVLCIIH